MAEAEFPRRRVNRLGQVTLPAELRRQAGLTPGTDIEFMEDPEGIVVRRVRAATSDTGRS